MNPKTFLQIAIAILGTSISNFSHADQQPAPFLKEIYELIKRDPLPEFGVPGQRELPIALPAEYDSRVFSDPEHPFNKGELGHGQLVWEDVRGPRENRINIGFVSDGYQTKEQFMKDFRRVVLDGAFARIEPYVTYRDRFNLYAFFSESPDSFPDWDNEKHFAFEYDKSVNHPFIRHIEVFTGDLDCYVILKKKTSTTPYSGLGGPGGAEVFIGEAKAEGWEDDDVAAFTHELGHVLGDVYEEYDSSPSGFEPEDYEGFLVMEEKVRDLGSRGNGTMNNFTGVPAEDYSNVPWKHWIDFEKCAQYGPLPWDYKLKAWNDDVFFKYINNRRYGEDRREKAFNNPTQLNGIYEWPDDPSTPYQERVSPTYDEKAYLEIFPIGLYQKGGKVPSFALVYSPTIISAMDYHPIAWYGPIVREQIMLETLLNRVWPFENLTTPNQVLQKPNSGSLTVSADLVGPDSVTYWWEIDGKVYEGETTTFQREIRKGEFVEFKRAYLTIDSSMGLSNQWSTLSLKSWDDTEFVRLDPANLRYAEHNWNLKVGNPENEREFVENRYGMSHNTNPRRAYYFYSYNYDNTDWEAEGYNENPIIKMPYDQWGKFQWTESFENLPYPKDSEIYPEISYSDFYQSDENDKTRPIEIKMIPGGIEGAIFRTHEAFNRATAYTFWRDAHPKNLRVSGKELPKHPATYEGRYSYWLDMYTHTNYLYVTLTFNGDMDGWLPYSTLPYENWVEMYLPREYLETLDDYGRSIDLDGDGFSFEEEFTLKSNPFDPNSNMDQSFQRNPDGSFKILIGEHQATKEYELYGSENLKDWERIESFIEKKEPEWFKAELLNSYDGSPYYVDKLRTFPASVTTPNPEKTIFYKVKVKTSSE